jgi:hypothetical protein
MSGNDKPNAKLLAFVRRMLSQRNADGYTDWSEYIELSEKENIWSCNDDDADTGKVKISFPDGVDRKKYALALLDAVRQDLLEDGLEVHINEDEDSVSIYVSWDEGDLETI